MELILRSAYDCIHTISCQMYIVLVNVQYVFSYMVNKQINQIHWLTIMNELIVDGDAIEITTKSTSAIDILTIQLHLTQTTQQCIFSLLIMILVPLDLKCYFH